MTQAVAGTTLAGTGAGDTRAACPECSRVSPSTRPNCLYCGAELPRTESNTRSAPLNVRPANSDEAGYNVVLVPAEDDAARRGTSALVRAELERLLGIDAAVFDLIQDCRAALPLARVASRDEAEMIEKRLAALNLSAIVLADAELLPRAEDVGRVRRLEIEGGELRVWCRGRESVAGADVPTRLELSRAVALVRGRLYTKRRETSARHDRKAAAFVIPVPPASREDDDRETFADENVIDIYLDASARTWRIAANSFDYSCLGARRTLLARDNFELLVAALRLAAGTARFDDSYPALARLLEPVWSLGEQRDARGHKRRGVGRVETRTEFVVDNADQFTRYARLCAHVERERRRRPERAGE